MGVQLKLMSSGLCEKQKQKQKQKEKENETVAEFSSFSFSWYASFFLPHQVFAS
jgi:hypothetical protein